MKQRLQVQQGLHLSLAPQLQQAIRLLQFSALELKQEIQRQLETNPLLEYDESTQSESEFESESSQTIEPVHVTALSMPAQQFIKSTTSTRTVSEDYPGLEATASTSETLVDYCRWQMQLTHFSEEEQAIALAIIDAIDEDGYCRASMTDIQYALLQQNQRSDLSKIVAVLQQIQKFDPPGVGARDIQECLLLQLQTHSATDATVQLARCLIQEHCHLLGHLNAIQLARKMKCDVIAMQQALKLIQSLNPRPGSIIGQAEIDYIIPDVICDRNGPNSWQVRLNETISPHIGLNKQYVSLLRGSENARDSQFVRDNLREARWFLKSLENRNHTLLRVAQCIVERQQAFLEWGEEAMQPMILQDVASQLEIHESTVSRITNKKYMYTPRGVYELKFFFSSAVKNNEGQSCSSTAIRAHIKRYVGAESCDKPLSDNKIVELMEQDQHIKVARRTITKYREAMGIPSSNERRFASRKVQEM